MNPFYSGDAQTFVLDFLSFMNVLSHFESFRFLYHRQNHVQMFKMARYRCRKRRLTTDSLTILHVGHEGTQHIVHGNILRRFVKQFPLRPGRVAVEYSHVSTEPEEWSMHDVWEGVTVEEPETTCNQVDAKLFSM